MSLKLTPKQKKMLYELEDVSEIFYGGAAGGGKTEGLLMCALRLCMEHPGAIALMLRRTFPELDKSLIRKSKKYFQPFGKYSEDKKKWTFATGSIVEFGYLEKDRDCEQYQSAEYDMILFDELGHFSEYQYLYMRSRLRPQGKGVVSGRMRAAGNPGGIGHQWIKAYFVDLANEKVYEAKEWDEEMNMETIRTRYFIPALLGENTLMTKQQRLEYRSFLNGLPEAERKMLRDGDWDYVPGAAFMELNRKVHGIDDIPVPKHANMILSFDYGFSKPFSLAWWWIDYDGRLYRCKEWYGWNGKPNEGLRMATSDIAKGILQREKDWGFTENNIMRVSNPDIFSRTPNIRGGGQGPSVAEIMSENGVHWNAADNDALMGKQQMHERLKVLEDDMPRIFIYNSCVHFWRTVPTLQLSESNPEEIDDSSTSIEDHPWHDCRAALMSRPVTPQRHATEIGKLKDKITKPSVKVDILDEIYNY